MALITLAIALLAVVDSALTAVADFVGVFVGAAGFLSGVLAAGLVSFADSSALPLDSSLTSFSLFFSLELINTVICVEY